MNEYRYRKLTQTFPLFTLTRNSTPTYGTSGSCYSVRVKTEWAENRKLKNVKGFDSGPEKFDGEAVSISRRDFLVPEPRSSEHVVMIAGAAVPAKDVYSQGSHRVTVKGKERIVTDWWAAQKPKKTWENFLKDKDGDSTKIMLKRGDRLRDEFFEPSERQLAAWRERYTANDEFKKKHHPRFFKAERVKDPPAIEVEVEKHEVTEQAPGTWVHDEEFIKTLSEMCPRLYTRPIWLQWDGQRCELPIKLAPPRDLDPTTFANYHRFPALETFQDSSKIWYVMPVCGVQVASRSECGEKSWSDGGQVESKRRKIFLGAISPETATERQYTEALLSGKLPALFGPDYDSELHKKYGHFYEFGFQYHHDKWWDVTNVFSLNRNTSMTKSVPWEEALAWNDKLIWNEAIKNTIEGVQFEDTVDGFYVVDKISDAAALRAYLVLKPEAKPEGFDYDDGVDYYDGGESESPQGSLVVSKIRLKAREKLHEVPAPMYGERDIQAQIRRTVGKMDVMTRTPETVMGNLRELVKAGEIRFIHFTFSDIHGVRWEVN